MEKKSAEVLAEELTELRKAHGKVREFIIPSDEDDETKTITLFLKPATSLIREFAYKTAKTNQKKAVYETLKMLRLGGDDLELLVSNDFAAECANGGLAEYLSVPAVVIKKN